MLILTLHKDKTVADQMFMFATMAGTMAALAVVLLYSDKLGRGLPVLATRDLSLVPPVVKVAKVVYKKPQYTDRLLSNDDGTNT
jgi:hypothetical protein